MIVKYRLFILFVLLPVFMTGCYTEDENRFRPGQSHKGEGGMDFDRLTEDYHPRLLMSSEDFAELKDKLQDGNSAELTQLHKIIMDICDTQVMTDNSTLAFQLDVSNLRILDVSRKALLRIFSCAYAYRITGEEKYLNKAAADIQAVCSFSDWNASRHFLDVGEMAAAVAFGYDWLYDELPDAIKTQAVTAINKFAFEPAGDSDLAWFYDRSTNWNQVCNGGLVCAALAIYEQSPASARTIIDRALETNAVAMSDIYSPNGNYPEGSGYWCYGTAYQVLMLSAMEAALGSDGGLSATAGFDETARYMQYMTGLGDKWFNYSDCGQAAQPAIATWYFADKFGDTSVLYNEMRMINNNSYPGSAEIRLFPMIMAYANRIDVGNISAPSSPVWTGNGENPVALFHTGWTWGESDKYLGIKGGKASSGHAHMDAGSFVYDAYGQRWSMDFGLQSYTTLENALAALGGNLHNHDQLSLRWRVFRLNNRNHSTITINDSDHLVNGAATINGIINTGTELGATVNMTNVVADQAASALRTVKIVEDRDLVVTDVVKALQSRPALLRWSMVTPAAPTVDNQNNRITLVNNGKIMHLTVTGDVGYNLKTWTTTSGNSYDAANPGTYIVGYEATVPANQTASFTVTLSPGS